MMKKMKIFEPAMCCSTGICGVGVDSELLRISTVLNTLEKHGVKVERFNLSNSPQEFITNKLINDFINSKGVDELPVVIVDDDIVITGRYPTNKEFKSLLEIQEDYLDTKPKSMKATLKKAKSCNCSDGNCC